MKKILFVFFTFAFIFTFVGCKNTASNSGNTSSKESTTSNSNSRGEDKSSKSQSDSEKETSTVKNKITMNIAVGNKTFTAVLEDNDTTKAFVKQLPLTVDMSELNGNEKYNYLSSNLRADKATCPGKINEGELMLYGDNCLVLFYKTFNTSYSYVSLGRIDNTAGLAEALGKGNSKVIFSVSE